VSLSKNNMLHKINFELTQISKENKIIEILSKKIVITELDPIELRAAASSMQSIYNGFEKVLIMLVKNKKLKLPSSTSWHSDLLILCKEEKIVSSSLETDLRELMGFRHFSRHAYSFMIENDLLKPLLLNIDSLITSFTNEMLDLF